MDTISSMPRSVKVQETGVDWMLVLLQTPPPGAAPLDG
jgi:hypothetical protein